MAGFHLHQCPFCLACVVVYKCNHSINAFIAALFAFSAPFLASEWPGADQGECPPLELVAVFLSKLAGCTNVFWFTNNFKFNAWKHCLKTVFHECNTQMGDINPDPLSI